MHPWAWRRLQSLALVDLQVNLWLSFLPPDPEELMDGEVPGYQGDVPGVGHDHDNLRALDDYYLT